jgi:hypothetical protein
MRDFWNLKAHIREPSDVITQRLILLVPYSLEIVFVPRLLAGSDKYVYKRLAQFFPRVKRVLGQAEEPLMASLVKDDWEVICHDVLVSCC